MGGNLIDDLKKVVSTECQLRIVFDNFDFKVQISFYEITVIPICIG